MITKRTQLNAEGAAAVNCIYCQEELEAERRINRIALLFGVFFIVFLLLLPALTKSGFGNPNDISNLIGAAIYILYTLIIFALLRRGIYHPVIKYLTISMAVSVITLVVFGYTYGVDYVHATRTVSLATYFLAIVLSGLYQNPVLPIYCAALISVEYSLLYVGAAISGEPILLRMETFRENILSWDILIVNLVMYLGSGFLMSLATIRHRRLAVQLQESSERLLRESEERRRSEAKARFLENFDNLTQLPNIKHFRERMVGQVEKAKSRERLFALMCIGIDAFKNVNQLYGTDTGHEVLQRVGMRLKAAFREDDVVCRFMGDKFLVLFSDLKSNDNMPDLFRKTRIAFATPFMTDTSEEIKLTAGAGLCTYPHDGDCVDTLIENAETAMYRAKTEGKGVFRLYDKQMHEELDMRIRLENELEQALTLDEFFLVYQPKVCRSGDMTGMEALIRWNSPERGLVPPDLFIPVAEGSGLIIEIGYKVLMMCCRQIQEWSRDGYSPVRITINVSPQQFGQHNFVDRVLVLLEQTGIDPDWLGIEITESGIMQHESECVAKMDALKDAGLTISIDDFGKGYSSLTRLGNYPLDTLKIDKSFVDGIPDSRSSTCIVRSIIDLGHNLGYSVIAEGVENDNQLDFLVVNGCDMFQGYYFHKPLPPQQIRPLLTRPRMDSAAGHPVHTLP